MSEPVIRTRGVTKSYADVRALKGIDLDIASGEVFALLGPNGAGKTTLVEILEGYRARSGGEASVLGLDPGKADRSWRARVGVVLQTNNVFDELTPLEIVSHFATFYPNPLDPSKVISMVGLEEKRKTRCIKLSGGQKRRVDLALGIVGNPELVFLDEPTTGLDPQGRRQIWDVVRSFTELGKTIVLTTHYLDEAEALADRVGIIRAGELIEVGPPDEIGGRDRAGARVTFTRDGVLGEGALPPLDGLVSEADGRVQVATDEPTAAVAALTRWAADHGVAELPALSVTRPSLEDVYLSMIGESEVAP